MKNSPSPRAGRPMVAEIRGIAVKLRVLPRGEASRIDGLLRRLRSRDLPRPLACVGEVLAVEFVPGEDLARLLKARAGTRELRWARATGGILARLHAVPPPRGRAPGPSFFLSLLRRTVRRLARAGLLEREPAARLLQLGAPRAARLAITHGDLHPENLVRTPSGRLRAIDEERLAVRPAAFDLARSVTRWPMTKRLEAALIAGYEAAGGDARGYLAHRDFWVAAAAALSAAYRMTDRRRPLAVPVAALRALAAGRAQP